LAIIENKLDENILNAFVSIENYSLFRLDRNRHDGGFCDVRPWSFALSQLTKRSGLKSRFLKANPSTSVLFIDLPLLIDLLTSSLKIFVFSVLLISISIWTTKMLCPVNWKIYVDPVNLTQIISSSARILSTSPSLIDLLLTSSTKIQTHSVIECGVSEHHLIYYVYRCKRTKHFPKTIRYRSFKNFNQVSGNFQPRSFELRLKANVWSCQHRLSMWLF